MNITPRGAELETAYNMKPASHKSELTDVGRGKPMGELLRRFWHPIGLKADAGETPQVVCSRGIEYDRIVGRRGAVSAAPWHRRSDRRRG